MDVCRLRERTDDGPQNDPNEVQYQVKNGLELRFGTIKTGERGNILPTPVLAAF